ncbi:MAG: calcium-binding protein [Hyphomicrobiaceae bacterium]
MATFTVTTLVDEIQGAGGTGTSLREAIAQANNSLGADTIVFDPSLGGGLIRLTRGELTISGQLTIDASLAGGITITGDRLNNDITVAGTDITDVALSAAANTLGDNSRIFNITSETAVTTLDSLTLTGGRTTADFTAGGAVSSLADLTLRDSTVSGNSTSGFGAAGGGIYGFQNVTLINSTVSDNSTAHELAAGGGLLAFNITLTDSTVSGNSAGWYGGGIAGDTVTLFGTTVSDNSAAFGGGIDAFRADLTNSTVSGNSAVSGPGGGISAIGAELTNSTVTGNSANSGGGGIYVDTAFRLTNTIVLGNYSGETALAEIARDSDSRLSSSSANGSNIVGANSSYFDTTGFSNIFHADPNLVFAQTIANGTATAGVLADNGGPVLTVALSTDVNNPAIDAGNDALAPTFDARGIPRFDAAVANNGTNISDLGAFEGKVRATFVVTTANDELDFSGPNATIASMGGANDLSLREAIFLANQLTETPDTIEFDPSVFIGGTASLIRLTLGEIEITDAITIDGSTGTDITITGDKDGDDVRVGGTSITDVAASYGGTPNAANDLLDDNSRIFDITSTEAATALAGLTLTGGRTTSGGEGGGAIRSQANLTIVDSTIAGNSTLGLASNGGGVASVGSASVTLTNSTVTGNSTLGGLSIGGGIAGGIASNITLTNSTVSGNTTIGLNADGGGIGSFGTVTLTNSTVSGNSTTGAIADGGGIFGDAVTLTNSTVSGNSTAGTGADGGGIFTSSSLTTINSIVLGNDSVQTSDDEVAGTITANGFNIVGANATAFDTTGLTNVINADPALVFAQTVANGTATAGVLADNGGPVETIALKADTTNPALDASNASAPALDALGHARIDQIGVANINGTAADLGAVEAAELPSLVVTTNLDVVDAYDGLTSLREAITFANSKANVDANTPDVVTFDAGVFSGGAASLIRLALGEIAITDAVTIDGSTGTGIVITGDKDNDDVTLAGTDITDVAASGATLLDDNSRIFNITSAAAATTLDSLTLTGGRTTADDAVGGAVRSLADLTLHDSTVSGNSTSGVAAAGGGISSFSNVTLTGSTVSGNVTAGNAADGGGIHSAGGAVALTNSAVIGNSVAGGRTGGGGVNGINVMLTNSTVSGNTMTGGEAIGGGIFGNIVTLANSTVSGNSVTSAVAEGGGIFAALSLALSNSIVLGNESAQTASDEVAGFGSFTANGLNIVGADSAAFDTTGLANIINADPTLVFAQTVANGTATAGVLADNGGPVHTIALNADILNPALDAASGTSATTADARGTAAFDIANVDNNGADAAVRDLGAFELGTQEAQSLVVTTNLDVVNAFDGLTSLREAVAYANSQAGADTITFDAAVFTGGVASLIRLTEGEIVITGEVTIDGVAVGGVTITGDRDGDDALVAGASITNMAASTAANTLSDNSRIFNITSASATTTLDSLTLTGGRTMGDDASGGAIRSLADLRLNDSTVSGNSTAGSGAFGGGIYSDLSVTLTNSTVSGNATAGTGADGGGIFGSSIVLTNSTVSANATVGTGADGGGIFGSSMVLTNSIVLGNDSAQTASDEVASFVPVSANGLNIVGADSAAFDTTGLANIINVDPALVFAQTVANGAMTAGVLADNGGPVQTIALRAALNNPALDRSNGSAPTTDARGVTRVDIPGIGSNGASFADLGAYELSDTPPTDLDLLNPLASIVENRSTSVPIKVADILVTDPDGGPNTLSLSGADAGLFEIAGNALFIKAGAVLDFETNSRLDVTVDVSADLNGPGIDLSQSLSIAVINVLDVIRGTPRADVLNGGIGADKIIALAGSDSIRGRAGDDIILGNSGKDRINAGGGNDIIKAGSGDDRINGAAGDDRIFGGSGDDRIAGGAGNDVIAAGSGNDRISGGGGNDVIIGGSGIDRMTGGSGADDFVFTTTAQISKGVLGVFGVELLAPYLGAGHRDVITDFQKGIDDIDLSSIDADTTRAGNQAFSFRGLGNSTGAGTLTYKTYDAPGTSNDKTIIFGNINGDAVVDFQIELTGIKTLTAGDFVL